MGSLVSSEFRASCARRRLVVKRVDHRYAIRRETNPAFGAGFAFGIVIAAYAPWPRFLSEKEEPSGGRRSLCPKRGDGAEKKKRQSQFRMSVIVTRKLKFASIRI